ncbi:MAG TPA: VUT family protein [Bacillota bacterium]
MKIKTKGRWLWMRTIGSTIVGEGVDTIVFIGVAFGGSMPGAALGGMILAQYLWKVAYEVGVTPLTYLLVKWIKRREQIDVFDTSVKYNPFDLRVEDGRI